METIIKITFKPVSGNRYKCNQTGKVMKKSQTEAYRISSHNQQVSKRNQARKEEDNWKFSHR